jgi:hypothetical protein
MLVTFSTKNHADVLMFGDIAIGLLKMMGHSGTVPSTQCPVPCWPRIFRWQCNI